MSTPKTKYDLEEARDMIARAGEAQVPDVGGRKDAIIALVQELLTLSTEGLKISDTNSQGRFMFGRGGAEVEFKIVDTSVVWVEYQGNSGYHRPITGLVYNPAKSIFEGPVIDKDSGWPQRRRSAAAVVAEQLLAVFHRMVKPSAR